jgi:hypothetical protein
MARSGSSDNVIIALALTLGLLALATPLVIRALLPISTASAASPERQRAPKPDLSSQRLAYPGGCGVSDFKDGRTIAAQIQRKLQVHRLEGLEVAVTAQCVTVVRGAVRSQAERKLVMKTVSHPWTTTDARGLIVLDGE